MVTVPPGPHILSDLLISSAIISEDGGAGAAFAAAGGGAGGGASEFGFDPNMDPELAMVCLCCLYQMYVCICCDCV